MAINNQFYNPMNFYQAPYQMPYPMMAQAPTYTVPYPVYYAVPQPVIYNIPSQSMYVQAPSQAPAQPQAPAQVQTATNPIQQEDSTKGASSVLRNYLIAQGKISNTQAVNNIQTTNQVQWKNNMKDDLRNSKVTMMAVIPRTMSAKDTDGNALIQGSEVRGNFVNATERINEIKKLGINTLHVLPIHEPGHKKAMGIAGSLYAPKDLLTFDPNLVDENPPMEAKKAITEIYQQRTGRTPARFSKNDPEMAFAQCQYFINECHKQGINVMLDLPSCVSVDFAEKHPELMSYEKDGSDKTPGGWQDIRMFKPFENEETRTLNKHLLELHKKYVDMCIGVGFDGIRADVGRAKPAEFWDIIIPYSRSKDPDFGWLAETYTYEDASPQLNMPHDRPIELMKAGFDAYYGQYHIFDQWTKASELRNYVNEQIDMQKEFEDKQPRTLIGSFSTHDDQSPMFYGGSPWVQFTSILQSTLPLCNPYFVDGVQSGDYYLYPYEHAYAPETQTDTNECIVHKGRIDIFNPSRQPGGNNPEIGRQIQNMLNLRTNKYNDVLTKGSTCWVKPKPDKDEIICFARQYGNKTLLVVGNRNVNKRNSATIPLRDIKEGQKLTDLTLPYGEKSYIQTKDGELNVDLAPSRIHVFEISAPHIENDAYDVSKFVNGVYTKVK